MSGLPGSYDIWRTTDPRDRDYPRGVEDRIGARVVVGQNKWGLGRWGTITSFFEEKEWDDDHGHYGAIYFEVEFSDGEHPHYETLDEHRVAEQLG